MKKDSNNKENSEEKTKEELMKELGILNLSLDTLYVILAAVLINVIYLNILISKTEDSIYDTNNSNFNINEKYLPVISNYMFLYATGIYLLINYNSYNETSNNINATAKEKNKTFDALLSSLLIFCATGISNGNLEV